MVLSPGLRVLLRYRVPSSEVEPTLRRVMDVIDASVPPGPTDQELTALARKVLDLIAPRPLKPVGLTASPLREFRAALLQCTGIEKEIVHRRYQGRQTIEEIAFSLQVGEDKVYDTLSRLRRRLLPFTRKE
jgi:DNA-directed RNA polymerase specialized sigma24 family protein